MLVVVARREKTDKLRTEVLPVARTKQIQQQPATILMVTQLLKRVTDLLGRKERERGKREQGKRERGKREQDKRERGKREQDKRERGKRERGKRERGKREVGEMSESKLTHREQRLFDKNGIVHTVKHPHHHHMTILLLNKQQKGSAHTLHLPPSPHPHHTYLLHICLE